MIDHLKRQKERLAELFAAVEGNARVLVITEGIAAISFQWYGTYISLYMLALGVSTIQVGLFQAVLILTQVISTLLGGYVADRFGRKRTLVIFDILCWGVPMLLYAIARNPWYFLVGRLINGFVYVVMPSFQCLFVEDVPPENRTAVFGMFQMLTSGARLLTPAAGWLVAIWGIVPAGRAIMAICMTSSISIALVRQFTLKETTIGRERIADVTGSTPLEIARAYLSAIKTLAGKRRTRTFVVVRSLIAFNTVIWTAYATIYLTDTRGIGLPESVVSIFPFLAALVTIAMIVVAAERLQSGAVLNTLLLGQALSAAAGLCFVLSPKGTLLWAVLWAVGNAASVALFRPASETYWANIVEDRERALIFSASAALMALVTVPAGPIAGALYTRFARAPFALGIALQLIALALTLWLRHQERRPIPTPERAR